MLIPGDKWVYFIDGMMEENGGAAREFLEAAYGADAYDPHMPWEIVLNCNGGDLEDGSAIHNALHGFSKRGGGTHHVTTNIRGKAYSMGSLIAQAGDHRKAGKLAMWMFHEPTTHLMDTPSNIADDQRVVREWLDSAVGIFMSRAKGITYEEFLVQICRTNWYLTADELLSYGFIDEIA